ncbi:hypothetical protein X777_00535 [Ooceraea biroi]|uniref:Uncharacterized protein n=1 Tax=Ooceraea biroi TaxID=2015173 RepID=A0A026VTX6_OOCBI|nr:hypothetical protein X777_00535 [Ooceraea biroi]
MDIEDMLKERDYEIQRQEEENRILDARYNKRFRIMNLGKDNPNYLRKSFMDKEENEKGIRALVGLRCGTREERIEKLFNDDIWEEKRKVLVKLASAKINRRDKAIERFSGEVFAIW